MSTPILESQQQVIRRPTGRDGDRYVIYEPDSRTPGAFFEVVNGRVTRADNAPAMQAIHRIPINGWLGVCPTLSGKHENDVYGRATAAGFPNIDELIEFLERYLGNPVV